MFLCLPIDAQKDRDNLTREMCQPIKSNNIIISLFLKKYIIYSLLTLHPIKKHVFSATFSTTYSALFLHVTHLSTYTLSMIFPFKNPR